MNNPLIDPDFNRNPCELIESRGFLCEIHYSITLDHYILTLFRIKNPFLEYHSNKKQEQEEETKEKKTNSIDAWITWILQLIILLEVLAGIQKFHQNMEMIFNLFQNLQI